jgi:cell division protein FtsQ
MSRVIRAPRFNPVQPTELPGDVRLTNAAAVVITAAVLGTALVGAALWVMRSPLFPVRSLVLAGELQHTTAATVHASAAPQLVGNFYSIDLQQARLAFEAAPWVRHAVVRRVWPDGLAVQLQEHQPVALWRGLSDADDSTRLVNHQGEVFIAPVDSNFAQQLPELAGPDGSSASLLAMYRRLVPVLQPLGKDIEGLQLSVRGSWRVDLGGDQGGASIELGRGNEDQVAQRTQQFVSSLAQATRAWQAPLAFADLRHKSGYAVRLQGVVPTANPAAAAGGAAPTAAPVATPAPSQTPAQTRAPASIAVAQKN